LRVLRHRHRHPWLECHGDRRAPGSTLGRHPALGPERPKSLTGHSLEKTFLPHYEKSFSCHIISSISHGGRSGFDVGQETEQGMSSTSKLVNPLENYKRQRRAFRSGRLSGEPLH